MNLFSRQRDAWKARFGMGIDQHGATIDRLEDVWSHHFTRTSHRAYRTVFEHDEPIAVLAGEIQVVRDDHNGEGVILLEQAQD